MHPRFKRFATGQRGRPRARGHMNGLEKQYAVRLEVAQQEGRIEWFAFEAMTLKLAEGTRYTPDFVVMNAAGELEFHECKGFMEEAAFIRIKVAADKFPFRFVLVRKKAKKDGGGWDIKTIGEESPAVTLPGMEAA